MAFLSFLVFPILIFFAFKSKNGSSKAQKNLWVIIGFVLFVIGVVSVVINLVGLNFGFLQWADTMGQLGAFLFKVTMIFIGVVLVVLVNSNEDSYDEYFDGDKYKK